ncbi:MAG TPA: hypothetical protein VE844_12885 [Gammaproteobacteria bacterium]|nr:hypothetical protein [Gammaproteobacteria bacterium]
MRKLILIPTDGTAHSVYLTAGAINSLIQTLPSGTAYCIGIVLIVMMRGRLMQHKGSLARAVLPLVIHLRWGWHRVERAMERGKFLLDGLFDRAYEWCLTQLDVEPVRLGCQQREVTALDSSTIARLRCRVGKAALLGKGYCHRAGRAVRANIVAAAVSVGLIHGVRLGLVRRVRFGASCEAAVSKLFADLPKSAAARLIIVDAGIATKEQFATATAHDALLGRLRRNCKLRCAPPPPNGKRGRNPIHGPVLHPGRAEPEVAPDEDFTLPGEAGLIRLRRWKEVHWEGYHQTPVDVLRVDDPTYKEPLLVGTTARELTTEELWQAYPHRWPVETLFYIGAETTATEKPRAWTEQAVERRIGLGLLSGSLLKAIAAMDEGLAMGPWDKKPQPSAGRLANHLEIHIDNLSTRALEGVQARNYRKNPGAAQTQDLQLKKTA